MYEIHDLLKEIEKQPALYLGNHSITNLQNFIDGYVLNKKIDQTSFTNFCNLYFCNSSSVSWSRLILDYNHGNEEQALTHFFNLYEMFFVENNRVDSRFILHKLLYYSLIEIRSQSNLNQDSTIFELSDFVHNLPLKLYKANYHQTLPFYDEILEEMVSKIEGNEYLNHLLFKNFPEISKCFWQIWQKENCVTLISKSENYIPEENENLLKEFFAVSYFNALKIKEILTLNQNI